MYTKLDPHEPDFIAFDLETTGRSPDYDRIIEIGAYNITTGETFNIILNPEKKLSQNIIELTHITQDMVDNGVSQREGIEQFMKFLGDNFTLLGHNLLFDLRFFSATLDRLGIKIPYLEYLDTLNISRVCNPDMKHHKLGDLCEKYGIENKAAHRAYEDAKATAEVYQALTDDAWNKLTDGQYTDLITPKEFEPKLAPATEKQISFIYSLLNELGLDEPVEHLSKNTASQKIDALLKQRDQQNSKQQTFNR